MVFPSELISLFRGWCVWKSCAKVVHRTKAATLASIDDEGEAQSDAEESEDLYATAFHDATCTRYVEEEGD